MKKTWAVTLKELRQIARDPLSLLVVLGMPAFFVVLYGFALNFDVRHVPLAVQDRDKSEASRALVASFVNSTYFDLTALPVDDADLAALTERGVAKTILVIPEDYGATLAAGGAATVQLLVDGADANTATTALGYVDALVAEANTGGLRSGLLKLGVAGAERGVSYEPRVFYNPELRSTRFLVPGLIGSMLMLTGVLSIALAVVREKERGTMEQLRLSPLSTRELLVGKALPYLAVSLVALVLILVLARLLFGVEVQGSYLDLFFATFLYLLVAIGFGLLISTAADSQAMALQMALLVSMLPSILLSGFIFQIRSMPPALRALTYLVPARHYIAIVRGVILKGSGLAPFASQLLALAVFAALLLGLTARRLRRREV